MNKKPEKAYTPRGIRQRKTRRRSRLLMLLVSCVVVAFAAFILQLDIWRIKVIEVQGTERVSPESVYEKAAIVTGEHILFISTGDARERTLELPLVSESRVTRRLPSRIVIQVRERQPYALLINKGAFYLVDEHAILLEKAAARPKFPLLTIRAETLNARGGVGRPVRFPHAGRFREICNAALSTVGERAKEIVFSENGVTVFLKNGLYVQIGEGDMAEQKLSLIPLLLEEAGALRGKVSGVNLKYLDSPSFVLK